MTQMPMGDKLVSVILIPVSDDVVNIHEVITDLRGTVHESTLLGSASGDLFARKVHVSVENTAHTHFSIDTGLTLHRIGQRLLGYHDDITLEGRNRTMGVDFRCQYDPRNVHNPYITHPIAEHLAEQLRESVGR